MAYPVDYTPSQAQIFRAVSGAVKNAVDGHKDWQITKTMAHSIAKRATGTLVAQMRPVLAAKPSEAALDSPVTTASRPASLTDPWDRGKARRGPPLPKAVKAVRWRSPLRTLHTSIGFLAGDARRAGNIERHQALVECLRLIAEQKTRVGA